MPRFWLGFTPSDTPSADPLGEDGSVSGFPQSSLFGGAQKQSYAGSCSHDSPSLCSLYRLLSCPAPDYMMESS